MSLFKSNQPAQAATTGPDYYFLDRIAPTISIEAAAHLKAVKAALAERPVTVLSGGWIRELMITSRCTAIKVISLPRARRMRTSLLSCMAIASSKISR